jgi:crotonobetainyl-CoA:carnitine CoA-transferase CaiB-like acyl-CoA transferase
MKGFAMAGALEGLRVIDLTQNLAGPMASMILGDNGADVIKVEPREGESVRRVPPFVEGESAPFMMWNRNKRSITLNLKDPDDFETMIGLLANADILIESYRPGAMDRLGLGWAALHARFPRLIYGSISGYGQTGPMSGRGGFDVMAQGMSGLMSVTGPREGEPHRIPIPICDLTAGLYITIGLLSAVEARHRTGEGQYVETSLLEAGTALQVYEAVHYFSTGENPPRMGQGHRGIAPYQVFPTSDGYVTIGAGQQAFYEQFCRLAGLPQLIEDPRFVSIPDRVTNVDELIALLSVATVRKPTEWWIAELESRAIPCGPVLTHDQLFRHPQIVARRMVEEVEHPRAGTVRALGMPIKMSLTPGTIRRPAPMLDEHSGELRDEIEAARKKADARA